MSSRTTYLVAFVLALFSLFPAYSQNKKEALEKKKKKLQQEINYNNKLLQRTNKDKQLSFTQLVILNKKIEKRQQLIGTIRAELRAVERKIEDNALFIEALENDIETLKKEYAQMIYYAFKNRSSYDRLMFIFAAEDFNQAYKRMKYIQQYSEYRKAQANAIKQTQQLLLEKQQELKAQRAQKRELLGIESNQRQQLASEKNEQESVYNNLRQKEAELKADIKKKEQEANKLQKAIEKIIEEEIKKKGKNFFALTPEAKALSASFAGNKGKLPWPVIKGVITGYFGEHPHPVLKQVKVKNNGIDISTTQGAKARAVFEGTVSRVIVIPGAGKAIMVRHGEYITIYSNLSDVYVKSGDKVTTKQELGSIITDSGDDKTTLHFELWKGKQILNPSYWVYRSK